MANLEDLESQFRFLIVDTLAREYGWSIEYISNLTMSELKGLFAQIRKRQETEDLRMQMNIARALTGKIASNFAPLNTSKVDKKDLSKDIESLRTLSKMLNIPIKKVQENAKH